MRIGRRVQAVGALVVTALLFAGTLPDSPVADAAMRGDVEAVRSLVAQGADVSAPQGDGMTALHWTAELGNVELAKTLIGAGADLDAATRIGHFTPLHVAGELGHASVVRALLEAGANPHSATTTSGETPLHYAAKAGSVEVIAALLDHGADVNVRQAAWGQTPLMFAAAWNQPAAVKTLLERGADPAVTSTVVDIMRLSQATAVAGRVRDSVMAEFRAASPDPVSWVPTPSQVQEAVRVAREYELEQPGIIDRIDWNEYQMKAEKGLSREQVEGYKGGLTALLHAAREGHRDAALALLEGGADINQVSAGDFTSPMLIAMIAGHFDLGLELLRLGADPNVVNDAGTAPLYAVINQQWGALARSPQRMNHLYQKASYLEAMEELLKAGADPNARLFKHLWYWQFSGPGGHFGADLWGATAFWRAAHGLDIDAMRLLVAYGADPHIPTKAPPGNEVDQGDGEKIVMSAADPSGMPPRPVGGAGVYPIHVVTGFGSHRASNFQRHVPDGWMPAVKYLVEELGADVTLRDFMGFGTVHYAAMRGNNELLLYLVEKGADARLVGRSGQTAADFANGPGVGGIRFEETIALLRTMGVEPTEPCRSCADIVVR